MIIINFLCVLVSDVLLKCYLKVESNTYLISNMQTANNSNKASKTHTHFRWFWSVWLSTHKCSNHC